MNYSYLNSYLEEKGIYVVNDKIKYDKEEKDTFKQIEKIILFNKAISPYKENVYPRIGASIGKEINNYGMQIFLIERYIKLLEEKKNLNSIDFYLVKRGNYIINMGRKALNHIYINNYENLIKRSMLGYEVCLTRVDEGNLTVDDSGKIIIRNIRYLTYNLIEHDMYSYIKRLKRKKIDYSMEEVIDHYINTAKLENSSREYLRGLAAYPSEELKIVERYILGKLKIEEKEIIESLNKAASIDNKGVII